MGSILCMVVRGVDDKVVTAIVVVESVVEGVVCSALNSSQQTSFFRV